MATGRVLASLGNFMLVIALLTCPATASTRPVVVIPGIMGSKLCDEAGTVIWGDRASYTAGRINALRLPFDVSARNPAIRSCGLIDSINMIPLLWESNVYVGLLKFLHDLNYTNQDIKVFDYDWRLSNFENAQLLSEFLERAVPAGEKVDVVAHSMGGLVARIYVQTLGGSARVHNLIMLGTPHLGSAKIFQRLRDGFDH